MARSWHRGWLFIGASIGALAVFVAQIALGWTAEFPVSVPLLAAVVLGLVGIALLVR